MNPLPTLPSPSITTEANTQLLTNCNRPHSFRHLKDGLSKCDKCGGLLETKDAREYADAVKRCEADRPWDKKVEKV